MIRDVWSLDLSKDEFRKTIEQIVAAENGGMTLGRITFETETEILSVGIEGTEPSLEPGQRVVKGISKLHD